MMTRDRSPKTRSDADDGERFEWDMTAVLLLVLIVVALLIIVMSVGPLGHRT
jgi:hypothetical protein